MTTPIFSAVPGRRRFLLTAIAGTLVGSRAFAAPAALGLADKPVQLVVPFTPGTTPDLCARLLGPALAAYAGRPFVVENKPGASGIIGLSAVAKAEPDGHTLTFSTNTALTLPFVYKTVPFDVLKSFTPVAMLGYTNFVLCVHPSLNVKTLAELAAYAKKHPDEVTYGSPGLGTLHHLCMEMLQSELGIKMMHVPYKGSAGATTDLLGGHIKAMFQPAHIAVPFQQEKKTIILGATRRQQDTTYPDIKPLAEVGAPKFDAVSWYGIWGPAGMRKEQVTSYNAEFNQLMKSNDAIKKGLTTQGITPMPIPVEQFQDMIQAEYDKWRVVVATAGLTPT